MTEQIEDLLKRQNNVNTQIAVLEAKKADKEKEIADKKSEQTAKEIMEQKELDEAKAKTEAANKKIAEQQAERDKRQAERSADRHAKELLRGKELFEQAQIKLEYDLLDIEMEAQKIGLSDIEIEQLETKNNLNREREEGLGPRRKRHGVPQNSLRDPYGA